jgi:hypothetical protein
MVWTCVIVLVGNTCTFSTNACPVVLSNVVVDLMVVFEGDLVDLTVVWEADDLTVDLDTDDLDDLTVDFVLFTDKGMIVCVLFVLFFT